MAEGQVVWITGASSGIGAALARQYADDGWQVAISARRADALEAIAAHAPARMHVHVLDVTDEAACQATAQAIADTFGPIDLAILNAGMRPGFSVDAIDAAAMNRCMTINVGGTINGIAAVLPAMQARDRGRIAMTASVAGYRGLPGAGPYAASKAAMISLAEGLHIDLVGSGVGISVICPGYVHTPLTQDFNEPMPFVIEADDAARRIRRGIARGDFEIAFPGPLVWMLKTLQRLPYVLYFPLIRRVAGG